MKLLPPLPPVLKRRSALVIGTLAATGLVIGGVAANAQAGSGHATQSTAVTTVAAVGTAPGDLAECAAVDLGELKLTPAQPATAVAVQADGKTVALKGIAVKSVPAKLANGKTVTGKAVAVKAVPAQALPAKGTAVKAVPGKLGVKAAARDGEAIATLAVPVCVTAAKAK